MPKGIAKGLSVVAWSFVFFVLAQGCADKNKPRFTKEELARIPFPQKTDLPKASGGFVLAVGDDTITSDEIIDSPIEHDGEFIPLSERLRPLAQAGNFEQFQKHAQPQLEQVLAARMSSILLYQEAKKQAPDNIDEALDKLVQAGVKKFVAGFGGDYAKAEDELKKMGINWQGFEEYQRKLILSQSYIASQLPGNKPVTHSQLLEYYNQIKDESFVIEQTAKFQLIDIEVARLRTPDPNKDQDELAEEVANKLIERLRAGADFAKLPDQYTGVSFVGFSKPVRPENLQKPYDVLAAQIEKIEPGQISEPIKTETGEHVFIVKLEQKRPKSYIPLQEVQKEVEARIIFGRHMQARDQITQRLLQQATIDERSEFIDFCLEEIYRVGNGQL